MIYGTFYCSISKMQKNAFSENQLLQPESGSGSEVDVVKSGSSENISVSDSVVSTSSSGQPANAASSDVSSSDQSVNAASSDGSSSHSDVHSSHSSSDLSSNKPSQSVQSASTSTSNGTEQVHVMLFIVLFILTNETTKMSVSTKMFSPLGFASYHKSSLRY